MRFGLFRLGIVCIMESACLLFARIKLLNLIPPTRDHVTVLSTFTEKSMPNERQKFFEFDFKK